MNTISKTLDKRYNRIALPSEFRFRRNTLKVLKCFLSVGFVCFMTVVVYKLLETYSSQHKIYKDPLANLDVIKADKLVAMNDNTKIDWHNYEQIAKDKSRTGPGEQGEAANFADIPKDLLDELYKVNGYNGALSDIISLHRALPDVRPQNCSIISYRKNLPTASIILPFHNEHLSVILRTVWSVIDRSPEHLIKDIILVDDCSTKESLKGELEDYLTNNIPKAKIIRLPKRSGLIVARQEGARAAKGEVLVVLDAHCEANVNWLPPLLDIVAEDYRTCACPFIDIMDPDTYKYIQDDGGRGMFDWNLVYARLYKFKKYSQYPHLPFESPVMAGGLFAISAKFFWELGGYDEGLFIWGGEQFELSFKIWQCGGKMLDVPCSRVGHLYRKFGAFENPDKEANFLCTNFRRVAEVWMDEYKEYYYMRQPKCAKMPYGDISKQLEIREKLQCKPFKWFMEEVAYDLTNRHPYIDPPDVAYGKFKNLGNVEICIETSDNYVETGQCSQESWHNKIQFTWRGEIKKKHSVKCWDIEQRQGHKTKLVLIDCHYGAGNQLWKYDEEKKTIRHSNSGDCVDIDPENPKKLVVVPYVQGSKSQQWDLENYNSAQQNKVMDYVRNIVIDERPKILQH